MSYQKAKVLSLDGIRSTTKEKALEIIRIHESFQPLSKVSF
jgi:hypothetical protein